jgi:hypothetical protein
MKENMKKPTNITEAQLLLNQEIEVRAPWNQELRGQTGIVNKIMADGQTLEVTLASGKVVFLDVTFVDEINTPQINLIDKPQDLGPIANSVVKDTI